MASFADSPGPIELSGLGFGFRSYDASKIMLADYGACNDGFLELSTSGWPGPEEGTTLLWQRPQTGDLVEVRTPRGTVPFRARVTPDIVKGANQLADLAYPEPKLVENSDETES